jgi:hypothetical protein
VHWLCVANYGCRRRADIHDQVKETQNNAKSLCLKTTAQSLGPSQLKVIRPWIRVILQVEPYCYCSDNRTQQCVKPYFGSEPRLKVCYYMQSPTEYIFCFRVLLLSLLVNKLHSPPSFLSDSASQVWTHPSTSLPATSLIPLSGLLSDHTSPSLLTFTCSEQPYTEGAAFSAPSPHVSLLHGKTQPILRRTYVELTLTRWRIAR